MNPETLCYIITTLVNAMKPSQAERFELIGRLSFSLAQPVVGEPITPVQTAVNQPTGEKAVASETVHPGNVMIAEGFVCECDGCGKQVYRIVSDVYENMKKKEFVACFHPLGDAPELSMPLDTWADTSGNIAIDCPLCKGTKTLWIKGHGDMPYSDVPDSQQA